MDYFTPAPIYNVTIEIYTQQNIQFNTLYYYKNCQLYVGHAVAQLVEALQVGRSRVRFPMLLLEFFIDIILPATL